MTFAGAEAGQPVAGPWMSADERRSAEAVEGVAGPAAAAPEPSAGQVQLRPYEPADAAATWKVFHAAVRNTAMACYSAEQVAAWAPDEVDADRWAHRRAAAWTLVAIHNRQVAGFTDLTDSGELDMLYVHPDHARRGVATCLVAAVVTEARRRGLLRLDVRTSRVLQPLLERFGFVLDEDIPDNRIGDQVLANARLHLDLWT